MKEAIKLQSDFKTVFFIFSSFLLSAEITINLNTLSHGKTLPTMICNIYDVNNSYPVCVMSQGINCDRKTIQIPYL